jgi:hypothetical protein
MKDLDDRQARRPVHHIIFRILACLFILAIGIFGMNGLAGLKKSPAAAKDEEPALKVEAIRAQPVDTQVVITGYGEVARPESGAHLTGGLRNDRRDSSPFGCGGDYPQGETLFRIDTRNYDAAMKEARATESNGKTPSNAWRNSLPSIGSVFLPCSVTGSWPNWNSSDCAFSSRETRSVPAPMWRKPNRSSMRPRTRLTS